MFSKTFKHFAKTKRPAGLFHISKFLKSTKTPERLPSYPGKKHEEKNICIFLKEKLEFKLDHYKI